MMRGIPLFLLVIFLTSTIQSQVYEITIDNAELVNQNTFEFDICIKSISSPFELTSYQCALTYYPKITNGGTLSFSYITGTSDINSIPNYGVGINITDGNGKLTLASMPGNDIIDTVQKRIGRFRLENTSAFGEYLRDIISLEWNFEGFITTILIGSNFVNITNPSGHIYRLDGTDRLVVNSVTASHTSGQLPEKTIDGLGYFDGDPTSFWQAQPTPKLISYDLGSVKTVSLTRFSFYAFNNSRKYIYSISVSTDNVNWTMVVNNDTSDLIEYTENKFEPVLAGYVRLGIISNNQNNQAALWETEIWGSEDGTIPVELNSFNGSVSNDKVTLNWTTNSELNNRGFEIERNLSYETANIWETIGFVEGNGTTTEGQNYTFADNDINPGKYFYRLKQLDFNGTYFYTDEIEIEITNVAENFQLYQNYPNPFNPETIISFSIPVEGKVRLTVFNLLGEKVTELINSKMPPGNHKISFNGENLSSGIYVYRLDIENQFSDIRKMILIK